MRTIILLGLLTAAHAAPVPPDAKAPPVTCAISSEQTVALGKAPVITVAVTNTTRAEILLAGSLDASDCKWRYPHCYFEITGPDGKPVVTGGGRCGNVNPLRKQDFVRVPAGKAFDPYKRLDDGRFFESHQIQPQIFAKPGEYRVRFVYSTEGWKPGASRKPAADEGVSDKLKEMVAQVPKVTVTSNEIKVTVVAPGDK